MRERKRNRATAEHSVNRLSEKKVQGHFHPLQPTLKDNHKRQRERERTREGLINSCRRGGMFLLLTELVPALPELCCL